MATISLTEPVRMDTDERTSDTLFRILKVRGLLFAATARHFERFSQVVDDQTLAFEVLRKVNQFKREKPDFPGFEEPDEGGIDEAFAKLSTIMQFDVFKLREGIQLPFEGLVNTTASIAREHPNLLKTWLYLLLSGNRNVAQSVMTESAPALHLLERLVDVSTDAAEVVAEYRDRSRARTRGGQDVEGNLR